MTLLATNKKGTFDYNICETFQAGIVLSGQEVKSIRGGKVSLRGAFVVITQLHGKPELFLINAHISPYQHSSHLAGYDPVRSRKLLLHKREIHSLVGKLQQKGLTMIPLKMYTKGSKIKVDVALASGKKKYDKREMMKKRDIARDIRAAMKRG